MPISPSVHLSSPDGEHKRLLAAWCRHTDRLPLISADYNPFTGEEAAPYFANLQANCKATTSAPGGYPTAPPTYGASSSAPAPTYPAGKPDAKTCECYAKLGQCQTGPNANQATCAAEFASW